MNAKAASGPLLSVTRYSVPFTMRALSISCRMYSLGVGRPNVSELSIFLDWSDNSKMDSRSALVATLNCIESASACSPHANAEKGLLSL